MNTLIKMQFDPKVAKKLNTDCAIIYANIQYWCHKNKANNKNKYDGKYWTYNSIKAFTEQFNYLTEKQIRRCLKKLEDSGYISVGNYNKAPFDQTKWYSDNSICLNGQHDLPKRADGSDQMGRPIPDTKPDTKPDIKPSKKSKDFSDEVIRSYNSLVKYFPEELRPKKNKSWLETIDRLNRIDGHSFDLIEEVVRKTRDDNFWRQNFLSLPKLRNKNKDGVQYFLVFKTKFAQKKDNHWKDNPNSKNITMEELIEQDTHGH